MAVGIADFRLPIRIRGAAAAGGSSSLTDPAVAAGRGERRVSVLGFAV
jgi:hypothetical protein